MAMVSVAEAAGRLGVSVPRIHQRIADGSLHAQRIGFQWAIDERSLFDAAERRLPGRPLSPRSAWAVIALSAGDGEAARALARNERVRANARLGRLLALGVKASGAEDDVRRVAAALRSQFRNRADRALFKAADADLEALRSDPRWRSLISSKASGIASRDVEGYVAREDLEPLAKDYLLMPSDDDANVIIHVLPPG
ncbi:MAG TPA: helix-turn-helix domain-containing protein, partial [Polyangiaceae bacterium]|nr:helix-turn-helix domain-containing protein [Polyangiaceae bacterium]